MQTALYLTDNSLCDDMAALCQRVLVRVAAGMPIVTVAQRPLPVEFTQHCMANVCVGDIGRSWMSLYRQILAGLDAVETEWVAICEHDCLYTREHLTHQPGIGGVFWYNRNCRLVQWGGNHPELDGMYSWWVNADGSPRYALSQLVCRADLLRQATEEVMHLLEMGLRVDKGQRWLGEPGCIDGALKRAAVEATSGRPTQLQRYLRDYVEGYTHGTFWTTQPNLDIRHGSNYTGPRRGKKRCYDLPPWGRFADLMEN